MSLHTHLARFKKSSCYYQHFNILNNIVLASTWISPSQASTVVETFLQRIEYFLSRMHQNSIKITSLYTQYKISKTNLNKTVNWYVPKYIHKTSWKCSWGGAPLKIFKTPISLLSHNYSKSILFTSLQTHHSHNQIFFSSSQVTRFILNFSLSQYEQHFVLVQPFNRTNKQILFNSFRSKARQMDFCCHEKYMLPKF